ncbi:hypothetical protein EJ04DRAFT_600930 [Polyplosphaeria fusca]|uniref:Polysaccharide lyase n=1 Tax=Polyplosphaeria fusca TaxID=682080 RepID=A0A9P4QWS1_9PLEO|nr:hypothetical protein EJ04DRAFT_600930 [Polyplosphaeria fusca]
MLFSASLCAFALLCIPSSHATPEFATHGKLSDWPSPQVAPEHNGVVSEATNGVFYPNKPSPGLKFEQTYDPNYHLRYHAERSYPEGYRRGQTKFYGFAFRLAQDWEFEPAQSYNIAQFIADFKDTGCGEDYMPSTMVWVSGRTLYTRRKLGQLLSGKACADPKDNCGGGKNCQQNFPIALFNNLEGGIWYKVTAQITWASDNTGQFKWWVNGDKVWDNRTLPTTVLDDGRPFQFRVGLYANGWYDDKRNKGSQDRRQVWIDEIGIGSEFADADPDRL